MLWLFKHLYLLWPLELPFVNALRSLIPYKWFNTTSTTFMIAINAQIDRTFIKMSPYKDVCNCGLFYASNLFIFVSLKGSIKVI
jgi:hypothetical protein